MTTIEDCELVIKNLDGSVSTILSATATNISITSRLSVTRMDLPRISAVRWPDNEGELRRQTEAEASTVPGDGAQALCRQPVLDGHLGDAHRDVPAVRQRGRRKSALRRRHRPLPGLRLRLLLHQGGDG
jgi:hypothetical protein